MEKIFLVKNQLDSKIIGRNYPQVSGSDDQRLFTENMRRVEEDKFKVVPPDGYSVKIQKSVKLTDFISSFMEAHTPILSEKMIRFLKDFKVPAYQSIPLRIYRVKELVTEPAYFIVQFFGNNILDIDFPSSGFDYLMGGASLDKSLLQFKDYADYLEKVAKNDKIALGKIKKTVMKPSLENDLFFLDTFKASSFFVKQRLKEAMDREGITGFSFEEVGYVGE